ncbi:hypothetical protein PMZ80_010180 [Knufia obscura]|uniref:DNA recombination and repair protein Rad51-like C-terminal domain-containing protein n=2 Tax=Knufia TaxID=430999 RepID=A0AAN8EP42_9EURO|nr:hypothetical protein PMZ80_010180 [Knufia obscura]KAK5952920.1 hypothetical protein OHC33_006041 [Knufia fluminis]
MSAEVFGAKLLAEVQEESLASNDARMKLLSELRAFQTPQPRAVTGLPEVDNIIEVYRYPPANTSAHAGRISSDFNIPSEDDFDHDHEYYESNLSPTRGPRVKTTKPKPLIIHISPGPHGSPAATAHLLYQLTALSILPRQHGGKHSTVAFVDCTNTFSATQLYRITLSHLRSSKSSTQLPPAASTIIAKDALSHVHVLQCTSSRSLLATLKDLPTYLLDASAHHSSDRPFTLLIINGINAFHYQDRFTAELTRLETVNVGPIAPSESLSTQILTELKKIQATFECTVIYTTSSFPSSSSSSALPTTTTATTPATRDDTSPLPAPNDTAGLDIYTRSALLNLHPSRVGVAQFAPAMSLEECLRDKEKRGEAVRKARYWVGSSAGGLGERRDIRTGHGELGFGMRVLSGGEVVFE